MKRSEDHFRFDTEKLIYEPIYALTDLNPLMILHTMQAMDKQART